jgi:hypothetical protein
MCEKTCYMSAKPLGTAILLEQIIHGNYTIKKLIVDSSMSIYGEGAYFTFDGANNYTKYAQ